MRAALHVCGDVVIAGREGTPLVEERVVGDRHERRIGVAAEEIEQLAQLVVMPRTVSCIDT